MKNRILCSVFFLLSVLSGLAAEASGDGIFSVTGIQFEISPEIYRSEDTFFNEVENSLSDLFSNEVKPDLIVFPEYIGVFYQLIEYNHIIMRHTDFQSALIEVLKENPRFESLADVFTMSPSVIGYLERWSVLADEYDVTLVAGSCFITDINGDLHNRSFVFNPDGELIYQQDKVFLTDFETEVIGLTPGSISDADFFEVEGQDIALTICRDTYATQWEQKNAGAFFWVDLKANGEAYDAEQQQSFLRALPLRMLRTDVKYGMTVCTVGEYLDLFWEGESTAIYKTGDKLALADISESFDDEDRIMLNIRMER